MKYSVFVLVIGAAVAMAGAACGDLIVNGGFEDGNFTGWTFAAVNAIASEVANNQFRLFKVTGDDHEELDDHPRQRHQPVQRQRRAIAAIEKGRQIMAALQFAL